MKKNIVHIQRRELHIGSRFCGSTHKISHSEGGMKEAIEEFKFEENLWHLSSKYHDYNPFECMNGIGAFKQSVITSPFN